MENPKYIDGVKIKECVGCGYCCITARCCTSLRIWPFTKGNECPGLFWKGERYICKLAAMDGPKGAEYRSELFVGAGCCANLNTWRNEIIPRRDCDFEQPKAIKYTLDKAFVAFLHALSRGFMNSDALFLACFGMAHTLNEQGVSEEEIEAITKEIVYHFSENRPRFQAEFMG